MHTLIINAHPDPHAPNSFSNQLAQYLQARLRADKVDVELLSLYESDIPELNAATMQIPALLKANSPLSTSHQAIADRSAAILEQFLAARRVVISLPLHNFNVPARLKSYVDNVVIPGKTFRYTPEGEEIGLMNDGRRMMVILASGGVREDDPQAGPEPAIDFLRIVFQDFLGFNSFEVVRAEGTAMPGRTPEQILQATREDIDRRLPAFLAS